jgi:hypothetical protein
MIKNVSLKTYNLMKKYFDEILKMYIFACKT